MKLSEIWETVGARFPRKIRLLKKWKFWILINEEAYCIAEYFRFKLTRLDASHIQMGFPNESLGYWKKKWKEKGLGYVLVEKILSENEELTEVPKEMFRIIEVEEGIYTEWLFQMNLEDYELTKARILGLARLGLEEKPVQNFLLKEKLESIHTDILRLFLRLPKQERMYMRETIERLLLAILGDTYAFMYKLSDRKILIQKIQSQAMIVREYLKHLYQMGLIRNDTVYLNFQDRFVEIFKMCKGIDNRL